VIARRLAAAALLALLGTTSAVSCADVLDLGGYESAPLAMCDLLDRCYGRAGFRLCLPHIEGRLEAAADADRELWLQGFLDKSCLQDCTSAWLCLDAIPVCEATSEACSDDEQCCGFTAGLSACQESRCCVQDGAACAVDGDCCGGACDPMSGTCGGVVCAPFGAPCANDFECCTQICDPTTNTCSQTVCAADGFPCEDGFDCCSNFCDVGQCAPPSCGQQGATCSDDGECCTGQCYDVLGVCSIGECAPDLFACENNEQCCSNFCDPEFLKCGEPITCADLDQPCVLDQECCTNKCGTSLTCACVPLGGGCVDTTQCCADECNGGVCGELQCSPPGEECANEDSCCSKRCEQVGLPTPQCCASEGCAHEVCAEGAPLDPVVCMDDASACVAAVCTLDPYCCCVAWDNLCVESVPMQCGTTCTMAQ
jgi:hypothetical protein